MTLGAVGNFWTAITHAPWILFWVALALVMRSLFKIEQAIRDKTQAIDTRPEVDITALELDVSNMQSDISSIGGDLSEIKAMLERQEWAREAREKMKE